ncbi:hypothetical protein WN51_04845 [Melipona quadrifasciata]|uniref:Uncharacterized protein n=1 Tax=Melipona quadrifasciata TaxID=166423 RepID=A0A0M8ZSA2_9HYME|nr:hypothetical protein WN51_04845 [Melipona quadrifasciata]
MSNFRMESSPLGGNGTRLKRNVATEKVRVLTRSAKIKAGDSWRSWHTRRLILVLIVCVSGASVRCCKTGSTYPQSVKKPGQKILFLAKISLTN